MHLTLRLKFATFGDMAHILVVDDEADVVTLIKFLLEKDGHRVSTAENGKKALEKLGVDPERDLGGDLPNLVVLGAQPVLIRGALKAEFEPGKITEFPTYRLGLIVKLRNQGPTDARVHLAVLEGCAYMDWLAAGSATGGTLDSRPLADVWAEFQSARQRIATTGSVRIASATE